MPDYTLIQGDCLEVMPTLEKGSVALVAADLPYGITAAKWDLPICPHEFWRHALHAAANGTVVLTATFRFACVMHAAANFAFRHDLVWHKSRPTGSLNSRRAPLRAHETMLVYGSGGVYTPQMTTGKKYCVTTQRRTSDIYGHENYVADNSHKGDKRFPRSVISVDEDDLRNDTLNGRVRTRLHPTQKPVALLEWLIATYTNPGDLVLDPVFGSNTTGVACARLGRRYIGIEKDPTYFAAGKARLEAEHARLAEQPAQGALAI